MAVSQQAAVRVECDSQPTKRVEKKLADEVRGLSYMLPVIEAMIECDILAPTPSSSYAGVHYCGGTFPCSRCFLGR